MGHGFDGNVAHTLGLTDPRIKTVIDIDSKITERKIFGRIEILPKPSDKLVLFLRASLQYQEDVKDQLLETKNTTVKAFSVQQLTTRHNF